MKKSCLLLFATLIMAGAAGCSDDSGGSYDFHGVWAYTETITAQTGGWTATTAQLTIEQDDRFITLIFPGQPPAQGLCDPEDSTFSASTPEGTRVCSYRGQGHEGNTLTGTAQCLSTTGGGRASFSWSATLIRR